ncbi:uncharacterized protein LOC117175448 [Belonocnema kinseyi]|uniref:uncharacterized protein LOC117175448 n=1 Tax=Belonocnema kinseyi TaxID=2817044 RepID=UPI00143D930D|nr:uncharacterized protein LOC117175448 [Belonocnema kinseyi]
MKLQEELKQAIRESRSSHTTLSNEQQESSPASPDTKKIYEIMPENTDILAFWESYQGCEELRAIAQKYLIVPATSVPSERVNSTTGNTITDKRSRLSPSVAELLVFLRQNYKFLQLSNK